MASTRLRLALALISLALPAQLLAQPTLPRDRAPAVPSALKTHVDRLYSPDPRVRAEAACQLRKDNRDATAAIPILLSMLSDDVVVEALECHMSPWLRKELRTSADARRWSQSSPAKEAADTLGHIGDAAVPGLIDALRHADWRTRKFAAYGLGEAEPLSWPGGGNRGPVGSSLGRPSRSSRTECVGARGNRGRLSRPGRAARFEGSR